MQGFIRIGTSGIVVPGAKQTFPKAFRNSSRLHYYGSLFNTLEINSSFYKLPLPSTFEKWAADVPDDFQFTVKLLRDITHAKNLLFPPEKIDQFMEAANMLGKKRGCLLVQFPASIREERASSVEKILNHLHPYVKNRGWKVCVELRHLSWYVPSTLSMFNKYKASLVFHDMEASQPPLSLADGKTMYLRFHGPDGNYRGSYSKEFLEKLAGQINHWANKGKNSYIYFNNTMGDAFKNAQMLKGLVS